MVTALRTAAATGIGLLVMLSAPLAIAQTTTVDLDVTVVDNADEISDSDEQWLINDTAAIDFPDAVDAVRYITFAENDDNINDTVENFLRSDHPEWIQEDSFAPGELIVVVGMDPRKHGVYCGNNVCDAIDLYGDGRLDGILESMVRPFQDGRIAAGLYEGAVSSADLEVRQESSNAGLWAGLGLFGIAGAAAAAIGGAVVASGRKKKAQTARDEFDYAQKHYGDVAQQLDGINVRAHSLTSPLANDELRRQWEDVHTRFLEVNTIFGNLERVNASSDDKTFREHADEISKAHTAVTQMETAQQNIDTLYDMEHGDTDTRRRELTRLRGDIQEARVEIDDKDSVLDATLEELVARTDTIDVNSESFMDEYARLITDYEVALRGVEKHMEEVEASEERSAPAIYESDWRVGTGYNSFVPFYMISTWHAADVSAAASSSSSSNYTSANTSFSSGFSGGGGSGSW